MALEETIFKNLVFNEEYSRKVLAFLRAEYFSDYKDRLVFELITDYVNKYNAPPSKEALAIDLSNKEGLNEQLFNETKDFISTLRNDNESKLEWLLDQTEKFCQDKAIYNAIMASIKVLDDKDGVAGKGSIPQLLSDALAVSFDTSIGHDYFEDANERFDFYHRKEEKIPFDLEYLNKITGGGLPKKTLNVCLAGTNVGKSLFMCHMAATNLAQGLNVLYITLEMSEERIAERIDANLLDIPLDELKTIPKDMYDRKLERLRGKTKGKLIVKEYPTASAGSSNFRHLLINELRIKKNFIPDMIYIDYLNICMSSRIKYSAQANSYTLVKAIAEELRGLAVEFDVPIMTATQTTRSGFTSSDPGLEDTSESFGLPATADFMFALISTEELYDLNQVLIKQLKNRYADPNINKRFVIGVDRPKMRLYNVEQNAQDDLIDKPIMDNTTFGSEDYERNRLGKKFDKKLLDGFK